MSKSSRFLIILTVASMVDILWGYSDKSLKFSLNDVGFNLGIGALIILVVWKGIPNVKKIRK